MSADNHLPRMDLIAHLRAYEAASNRADVETCTAMFAEDGAIDDHGIRVAGRAAIHAAHAYDHAVEARVRFDDPHVEDGAVCCRFVYTKSLDRLLGLDGFHQQARFTFRDGMIVEFAIFGAERAEIKRHRARKGPFLDWSREHQPELFARLRTFGGDAGQALRSLEAAWVAAGRPTESP